MYKAFVFALFFSVPLAHAQASKSANSKRYSQDPIDTNTVTFTKGFQGHSCIEILKRLKTLKLTKSEFESSDEYSKRTESFGATKFYGNITGSDSMIFLDKEMKSSEKYDADSGSMEITIFMTGDEQIIGDKEVVKSAVIDSNVASKKSYIASNSFGKSTKVNQTIYNVCALTFSNMSHFSSGIIQAKFPLTPDVARTAKGNLEIMYVGNLTAPFFQEYHGYLAPTISNPVELAYRGNALVFHLSQFWVMDKNTGTILTKIDR